MGRCSALVAGASVLAGTLAACGSSSSPAGSAADAPADASASSFCTTFAEIDSDVAPSTIADRLTSVGTPSGISSQARQGFEVLVAHVRVLPRNPDNSDLTALVKGLKTSDRAAVTTFWTYYGNECEPVPSDSAS